MPLNLQNLFESALRFVATPLGFTVLVVGMFLAGLAAAARRSVFWLSFVMIFLPPLGAALMLLEKRSWRPLWKRLYALLAAASALFYMTPLGPVDAWLLSMWSGALLTAAFFSLQWGLRFFRSPGQAETPARHVHQLLAEKEIRVEHRLVAADGMTGFGFHPGRKIAYLVRPGKSFPQEITPRGFLSVQVVENDTVISEYRPSPLQEGPFPREKFGPSPLGEQQPNHIGRVELRFAVADFLEPVLTLKLLTTPVRRGSKRHAASLLEAHRWFQMVKRWMLTERIEPAPAPTSPNSEARYLNRFFESDPTFRK